MNSWEKIFCYMLHQHTLNSQPKHEIAAAPKYAGGDLAEIL